MEARNIDAKMILEAIGKDREDKRIEKVNLTICILEETAAKMMETLSTYRKIERIGTWERDRFTEPEVREWIESRGFKIREVRAGFFNLVIPDPE